MTVTDQEREKNRRAILDAQAAQEKKLTELATRITELEAAVKALGESNAQEDDDGF